MKFERVKERVVYQNKWILLYDDEVRRPDGTPGTYVRLSYLGNPPGVVIIPVSPDERLLLVTIHRYAVGDFCVEFPRGNGQPGESTDLTVRKELFEETGLRATSLEFLGYCRPDSAIVMTEASVFQANVEGCSANLVKPGNEEGISSCDFYPESDVWKMVENGRIRDGFTLSALALLTARRMANRTNQTHGQSASLLH